MENTVTLPAAFESQMHKLLGAEYNQFKSSLSTPPATSIRLNPKKQFVESIDWKNVPWCELGRYLHERPLFTLDPLFHAGAYYVQEASSMFLDYIVRHVFDINIPIQALDLCAAPGGKSTLLNSSLPPGSLLLANEVIKSRYSILTENLIKWGYASSVSTALDSQQFLSLSNFFDLVVVDAPCSGEGLFRKDQKAINEWSLDHVKLCTARQKRILSNAVNLVKPEGVIIYSTCTYNDDEDDSNAEWLITEFGFERIQLPIPPEWNIRNKQFGWQFYPHLTHGEGFYLSILRKPVAKIKSPRAKAFRKQQELGKKQTELICPWLENADQLKFIIDTSGVVRGYPKNNKSYLQIIDNALPRVVIGLPIGTLKHNTFIPHHGLASGLLSNSTIPRVPLNRSNALRYLAKETISITPPQKGWMLAEYQGIPLGWIKKLPNRINNYFPKEWRIRMSLEKHLN